MGCADLLEPVTHYPVGEFRFVAFTAEVGEIKMVQVGGHDLRDGFSSGLIREMAVTAEDALLQAPGAADTILQHFHVMIGFEHENIGGTDPLDDQFCHMAEVGDEANVAGGGVKQETDGILGIVRDGERVHKHVTSFKARAGLEQVAVEFGFQLVFERFFCSAVAINRDVKFGGDSD